MAADQYNVWIYTMQTGGTGGKWSRYQFPWIIEHFAHMGDKLYCREGDNVHRVEPDDLYDNGEVFSSVLQWPWLDFGRPGVTKYMTGFDMVCNGDVTVQVGYNQKDTDAFTTEFEIPGDTLPDDVIPLPVASPTFSMKLTYNSEDDWEWQATQLYLQDHKAGV